MAKGLGWQTGMSKVLAKAIWPLSFGADVDSLRAMTRSPGAKTPDRDLALMHLWLTACTTRKWRSALHSKR